MPTFALAAVGFLFSGLVAPLAALSAVAAIVCGALGLRAPRTRSNVVSVAVALALVAVPAIGVAIFAIALVSGGIE